MIKQERSSKAAAVDSNYLPRYVTYLLLLLLAIFIIPLSAKAATYTLPASGDNVVGKVRTGVVEHGENLAHVARRYDVGYYEILEANPNVNPLKLKSGMRVVIPSQYVLPDAPRQGIVINLAELRLYEYPEGTNTVVTEPIGIGRLGGDFATPTGNFTIIEKKKDPAWHVPKSVAEDMAARGVILPAVIPPGPDNPLGQYMLRLSNYTYLIHGTNKAEGVGRRTSAGCIRMYPEDIETLFYSVPVGTPVTIINQPYKVGRLGDQVLLESHRPLREQREEVGDNFQPLLTATVDQATADKSVKLSWDKIQQIANAQSGLPGVIGSVG